jgi:hypothetical protein
MNENKRTIWFVATAVVLVILALVMAPKKYTPGAFLDQGEAFFPNFTDPNQATTLEVIEFDSTTGTTRPFKVTFQGGRWTIPSHHDYPADAKTRLAQTAAGVIDIKKDDFRSDNVSDHEQCGVVDPSDESAELAGRGQRITLKDGSGQVLADFIVGRPATEGTGLRFVRVPDQKRVYTARMNLDLSTRFEDWIETDLLQLTATKISRIDINDYSIDERSGSVNKRDNVTLTKRSGQWAMTGLKGSQSLDTAKVTAMVNALSQVKITGVRPKPAGISASLSQNSGAQEISRNDMRSLQSKGFYLSREGQLLSNEGELLILTTEGVRYTVRFGEVAYGSGSAITAGTQGESEEKGSGPSENRYLFVTTNFVDNAFIEPPQPSNTDYEDKPDSLLTDEDRQNRSIKQQWDTWNRQVNNGRKANDKLNARFAAWYYLISSENFDQLHLSRGDLIAK